MTDIEKSMKKLNEYLWYAIIVEFQLFGTVWAMMDVSGKPYLLSILGICGIGVSKALRSGKYLERMASDSCIWYHIGMQFSKFTG